MPRPRQPETGKRGWLHRLAHSHCTCVTHHANSTPGARGTRAPRAWHSWHPWHARAHAQGKWCPSLPEAVSTGFGLTPPKPLPTFQSRVTEAGDIEVMA